LTVSDARSGLGRLIALGIVAGAVILAVVVVLRTVRHPQTDDAIVTADTIGVVPQVSGTIVELHVVDNQAVKAGDLLFVIDPRPYELAVKRARAELAALDGEIEVTQRHIEGQRDNVAAARAEVQRTEAQVKNATDSLNRMEPLLPKEFVTPDKIEQARTAKLTAEAGLDEARKKRDQAEQDVGDLNALLAKREAAQAALGKAELDLSFCSIRAEFDALVVNLHTAIGQFVAPGTVPVFSLVDTRNWYVMANYRETELDRIAPGMEADVYVLTDPRTHFRGIVQGIGWAVNPEDQPIAPGLPKIERELNWVHIAQRFPVRIRIENPQPPHLFRVGASAVSIIQGWPAEHPNGAPPSPGGA
jgi:multidrug efflux system membrane fusion protein